MKPIKNIHFAEGVLSEDDIKFLNQSARYFAKESGVDFKFHSLDKDSATIEVRQNGPGPDPGKILEVKKLVSIGKELISEVLPDATVYVRPVPYKAPPVDIVTPEWVQERMSNKRMSSKAIRDLTGIHKGNISSWISGRRNMSQPVKAMFYLLLKD